MFQKISVSEKFDGYEGGGEYQDFPSKSLCLTVPKIFVGEFFSVSLTLGIEKKLGIRERERERERETGLRFFVVIVVSHSNETFRRGTLRCFRKFRVSKNFMPKRGISRFSIEYLLSHSTENLRRRTLLCCVSENFG